MTYAVIGSGPCGANAALTLLQRGLRVELHDVGVEDPAPPLPQASFAGLKEGLDDPISYFLGDRYQALIPPGSQELMVYPPARRFLVSRSSTLMRLDAWAFDPVLSHTRGGLGVAWGANALQYDDDDLSDWPITSGDLREGFRTVGSRLRIAGSTEDALSPYLPTDHPVDPPVPFSTHDSLLWRNWRHTANRIVRSDGIVLGHARMAVDRRDGSEHRCDLLGRCLWGCPSRSIYDPRNTLAECARYADFTYRRHSLVSHFESSEGALRTMVVIDPRSQTTARVPVSRVILAAGAISSGAIMLRTLQRDPGSPLAGAPRGDLRTPSVLDTVMFKVPYVLLGMLGRRNPEREFQFNRLILRLENREVPEYPRHIHGEILSLATLLFHPMIETLPCGSRAGRRLFHLIRTALGAVSYFIPDRPYARNGMVLEPDAETATGDRVVIDYETDPRRERLARDILRRHFAAWTKLRCFSPPSQAIFSPDGHGVHYGGTVPMSTQADPRCVDAGGRSHAYRNLHVADGATFPSLPSRSLTLNLIANAIRIASLA